MNVSILRDRLRENLLRMWLHLSAGNQTRAEERDAALRPILESFLDHLAAADGLPFAERSPESRLISALFPAGLPAIECYGQITDRPLPSDHVAMATSLLVGSSPAIWNTIATALRLAPTSVPVLVTGETGTGKELVAQIIHRASDRAHKPLITVNCAAMPETLLLAELFGYEPGAFTGAAPRGRMGKLEAADGGTLFLDEVGELPPAGQSALLRFLDSGEVQKIGRVQPRKVSVRLICATHCDLEAKVRHGAFRKDLFYRIALLPVSVPPLRERLSDIPALVAHFLREFQVRHRRDFPNQVSGDVMQRFQSYAWPGNVRELMFVLERAFLLCDGPVIETVPLLGVDSGSQSNGRLAQLENEILTRLRTVRPALFGDGKRWAHFLASHANDEITTGAVAREFCLSEASVRIRLAALVSLGLLESRGVRKGRRYRVKAAS